MLILEPADRVGEAETIVALLTSEFRIFKDLVEQGCNLMDLVKEHIRSYRTYEEELLMREVSETA